MSNKLLLVYYYVLFSFTLLHASNIIIPASNNTISEHSNTSASQGSTIHNTVVNAAPTDITLSNTTITDGSLSGSTVGYLSTTDPGETEDHTYDLASGGADNSGFVIFGNVLQSKFTANASTKNSYSIKIRSTDSGGLYLDKDFTISVVTTATVWNGDVITFTKSDYADWTLEANQDRITSNIWLTRKDNQGLFNIYNEAGFEYFYSPYGTEWAYGTTANYASLEYSDWQNMSGGIPPSAVNKDAVLHLINEHIYIDIKFTSWSEGSTGGGFSYQRSTDPNLPVELNSFSAIVNNSSVQLNWQTATEVNNYGFEVERFQGIWQKIGFVNGNGNSNSTKYYSYEDDKIVSGKYAYRLKQIDNNGQYKYSKIVEVSFVKPDEYSLEQNYPNPFNPTTTIQYSLPKDANVKLSIYNLLGQEIKTLVNNYETAGVHKISFDAVNLNSGIYIYKIEAGPFIQMKKMTLLK